MSRHDSGTHDEQWKKLEPLLPKVKRSNRGGRPPKDNRACFEGILVGAAIRRPLEGSAGAISLAQHLLASAPGLGGARRLARHLASVPGRTDEQGRLDWEETFADGSFARRKKGECVGKTKRGKGTKWMVVASGQGLPLGVQLASAARTKRR